MDRKQIIGLVLIFILVALFSWYNSPTEEQINEQARQDSITQLSQNLPETENTSDEIKKVASIPQTDMDSVDQLQSRLIYGDFYNAVNGTEDSLVLENDRLKLTFSNKGGRIIEAWLKKYNGVEEGPKNEEIYTDLKLMNNPDSRFEYLLPVNKTKDGFISTGDLYFDAQSSSKSIVFTVTSNSGVTIQQEYSLTDNPYKIDYNLSTNNLGVLVDRNTSSIELNWIDYLNKLEKNSKFEKTYSTLHYRTVEDGTGYCSYTKSDEDDISGQKVEWISNSNQFFTTALMAGEGKNFEGGILSTDVPQNEETPYLKKTDAQVFIPIQGGSDENFDMSFYIGPNEYDRLKAFDNDLEESINFGRSVFGTINRWVVRPIFLFFLNLTNSAGFAILLLILLVKMVLYPLTYKMLKSSAKMGALKPEINQIKEKYKDDSQTSQMKTMELYRKFGVSPFGGCMPMVMQMPIWFALFRFFPAAFEFRQRSFLWATDLSSYDALFHLPFEIPMFGAHLSLFALLWTISTLVYTYYNTQNMDMGGANSQAMKYMQYFMPVIFIVFFNNYASGLTAYMFFSNLINIIQTVVTKKFVFDEDKIRSELELKKDKPKKKNSFSKRLEEAMKQQQKVAEEKKKGGKKR